MRWRDLTRMEAAKACVKRIPQSPAVTAPAGAPGKRSFLGWKARGPNPPVGYDDSPLWQRGRIPQSATPTAPFGKGAEYASLVKGRGTACGEGI